MNDMRLLESWTFYRYGGLVYLDYMHMFLSQGVTNTVETISH